MEKSLISLLNKDKSFKVNNKDKYHIMEYHGNITESKLLRINFAP